MEEVVSAVNRPNVTCYDNTIMILCVQPVVLNKQLRRLEVTPGILDYCEKDFVDGRIELICKGVKFNRLMDIPFIDRTQVYSTNTFENANIFGIEAARKSLYNETIRVLQFDGADIYKGYIHLICDVMCMDGKINSIAHLSDTITNAFFEKEIKKINAYSLTTTVDECKSVEAAVFLGHAPRMGTGGFDVLCR
jgi:DNA-directed RNA polymerase subunit A"